MKTLIIAIDGPAGAGKSTVSKMLADALKITVLDTGALFRAMALYCIENEVNMSEESALIDALSQVSLSVSIGPNGQITQVNGADVSGQIRTPAVSAGASLLGTSRYVRQILTEQVRKIASCGSYVVEGRDIGSAMLPNATVKFFLTASAEERARRRCSEMVGTAKEQPYETVLEEIIARDKQDENREIAPLVCAEDAITIDSSAMSIDEVVSEMLSRIGARRI